MSAEDVPLNGLVKLSEGRSSGNVQGAHVDGKDSRDIQEQERAQSLVMLIQP